MAEISDRPELIRVRNGGNFSDKSPNCSSHHSPTPWTMYIFCFAHLYFSNNIFLQQTEIGILRDSLFRANEELRQMAKERSILRERPQSHVTPIPSRERIEAESTAASDTVHPLSTPLFNLVFLVFFSAVFLARLLSFHCRRLFSFEFIATLPLHFPLTIFFNKKYVF